MRIQDVMIDRYGAWNDLLLPVNTEGVTLIHGPNEAGKSTIMRFIRGVLYGFPATGLVRDPHQEVHQNQGGSLRLQLGRRSMEVSRFIDEHGRQMFRASLEGKGNSESEFQERLQGVDAEVYRTIFTLGLKELRELATLQVDQVGERIYGTTLGMIGERLMRSEQHASSRVHTLSNPSGKSGQLFELSGEFANVDAALAEADQLMNKYQDSWKQIRELESKQQGRKERLAKLKRERNNYQHLQRIWGPWNRQRELTREWERMADTQQIPHDGLSRLDQITGKLSSLSDRVRRLSKDRRIQKQALSSNQQHTTIRDHASGIRALIDLRQLVESSERHLADANADVSMLKSELDDKLRAPGVNMSIQQLGSIDCSPSAQMRLSQSARTYQAAIRRRARHRRKYKRLADKHHLQQTECRDRLKRLGISSLDQAIKEAEGRLANLETVAQHRLKLNEYTQRIQSAKSQLDNQSMSRELPWWAQTTLTLFAMAGGFFVLAGLVQGVQTGWVVGLIYLLTGLMGGALAWALQNHYESDDHSFVRKLRHEIDHCERKEQEVRQEIDRLIGSRSARSNYYRGAPQPVSRTDLSNLTTLVKQAGEHLAELRQLKQTQNKLEQTRKTLSVQRGKLPHYQKEVSTTRQSWCDLLKQLGLRETVRTSEAFQQWQHALDAGQTHMQWELARQDASRCQDLLNQFREQMELIAGRVSLESHSGMPLSQTLTHWQRLLDDYTTSESEYQTQRNQYRDLRRRYESAKSEQNRVQSDLSALLHEVGVRSPEEYRERAKQQQRARELEALLADVQDQLNSLSREEPELAIVEEDLLAFDEKGNRERIEMLGLEIEDLEGDLNRDSELIGTLRQSLTSYEQDTTPDDLRLRREQILNRAANTVQDLQANRIVSTAFSRMTAEFEERFQPEALARASEYLDRLTVGRYQQVRSPAGTRELLVQEHTGAIRRVPELSDGTREQLFLAIRMALIETFRAEGIEMPVVFDDIFVNFDQQRTSAAVETLLEFAEDRQVLFFTCHEHVANMFEGKGVEPIWLPSIGRPEARLAG